MGTFGPILRVLRGPGSPGTALRRAIIAASIVAGAGAASTAWADKPNLPDKPPGGSGAKPSAPANASQAARAAAMKAATGQPSASPSAAGSAAAPGGDKQKKAASAWAALNQYNLKNGKLDDRLEALRQKIDARKKTFDDRRSAEQERIRIRWGALVDRPNVQDELRLHAQRIAWLERIQELAEVEGKPADEARALKATDRENARHDKRMQEIAMTPAAIPGGAQ